METWKAIMRSLMLIKLGIIVAAILLGVAVKLLLYFDYILALGLVWGIILNALFSPEGALYGLTVHPVFVILISIAILAIWHGIQRFEIKKIYILRIPAFVFVAYSLSKLIARFEWADTIWLWTIGVCYFAILVLHRNPAPLLWGKRCKQGKVEPKFAKTQI